MNCYFSSWRPKFSTSNSNSTNLQSIKLTWYFKKKSKFLTLYCNFTPFKYFNFTTMLYKEHFFPRSMGHLRIRHLARTNRNALGGKGFGGNIFVAHMHGGKIFAISVFSLTSSFPVFFFSEPWKIHRPLQLSLTPTLTLPGHTWISFHFFGGRQRSPLGLYHSLHNHLRHPDDRRPGKKGRRVDADLALGFSPELRSKATASCRRLSSGGFRGVADFVHGKMDGMHVWSTASSSTFEAFPRTRAFVFTLPWLFCILASQVFNFFSSDRHFSSDKFRLVLHDRFFFLLCLLSFSVLSSKERLHIRPCTTWQSLQNISTSVRRQAMEWESFLFACRAAGTSEHVHAAGLDHFETSGRISACIVNMVKEHWEARWKFSACHPVRDAMRDKT